MNKTAARPALLDEVQSVLSTPELPALGPAKRPGVKTPAQLRRELEDVFARSSFNARGQELICAAALLWHDHLDEAHEIVQDEGSAEAAFLHGIMHRREPDYSNAKYWFHRVGRHRTFPAIGAKIGVFQSSRPAPLNLQLVVNDVWQPMHFIDACEAVAARPLSDAGVKWLQEIQRIEFDALLEHIVTESV